MSSEKREMHRGYVHAWRTTRQALTRSPSHLECNPPAEVQSLDLPLEEQSQKDVDKEVTSADMEMIMNPWLLTLKKKQKTTVGICHWQKNCPPGQVNTR